MKIKSLKSNRVKQHKFIFRILLFYSILTFGSYSFLSYTLDGQPADNIILKVLSYTRIIIVWFPVIYFSTSNIWNLVWRQNKDLILLFITAVISSFFSSNFLLTFAYTLWFIGTILSILLYLSVLLKYYKNPLEIFLKDLHQLFFIVVLFIIPSLSNLISKGPEFLYFSSKNFYIYYVLILLALYLINFSHFKFISNKKQIFHLFIFLVLLLSVFISGKRSVLITVILELLIFIIFSHSQKYKYKSLQKFFATALILSAAFIIISNWNYYSSQYSTFSRFDRLINSSNISTGQIDDSSYEARLFIWNEYLNAFEESPIFGKGFLGAQIQLGGGFKDDALSAHSTFLSILTDLGLVGALFFGLIIIRRLFFVLLKFNPTNKIIYVILFIPVLLINYSENNLYPGQIFFMYSMLVILSPFFFKFNDNLKP